jgi:hypothetical protein
MCGGDVRGESLDPNPRWKGGENLLDGKFPCNNNTKRATGALGLQSVRRVRYWLIAAR